MSSERNYLFRIVFSGLCAYVPRGSDERRPERFDVLLLKAPPPPPPPLPQDKDSAGGTPQEPEKQQLTLDLEGAYEAYEVHHPVLRFALKNLPGHNLVKGEAHGFWLLQGEDVSFFHAERDGSDAQPLKGKLRLKRKGRVPGSDKPDPRDGDQVTDISWLPEMGKIIPEAADIDPQWVRDDNPSFRIAARFHLEKGKVISWKISDYRREYVVAQFIPAYNECQPYVQAVAHWVAVEVKVPVGRSILVRAQTYEFREERSVLLQPSDSEPPLEISVTNLCCGYALTERGYGIEKPEPDEDFEHLFELCRRRDDLRGKYVRLPVPVPVKYAAQRQGTEGGGVDPLRCTGARFRIVPL